MLSAKIKVCQSLHAQVYPNVARTDSFAPKRAREEEPVHACTHDPMTPDRTPYLHQHPPLIAHGDPRSFLEGDIALTPRRAMRTRTTLRMATDCVSPSANTRVRRAQYGLALTQSPARAGHSVRMKEIFGGAEYHGGNSLYPQLPNISRRVASLPLDNAGEDDKASRNSTPSSTELSSDSASLPQAIARPAQEFPGASKLCIGESVGNNDSWSDDTGYLDASSSTRSSRINQLPAERIHAWLQTISDCDAVRNHDNDVCTSPLTSISAAAKKATRSAFESGQSPLSIMDHPLDRHNQHVDDHDDEQDLSLGTNLGIDTASHGSTHSRPEHCPDTSMSSSTFVLSTRKKESSKFPAGKSDEDVVDIKPLSPNVCVERGPSRHHLTPKVHFSDRFSTPDFPAESKDAWLDGNIPLKPVTVSSLGSPFARRKDRRW
jgi:hypothetical protein